jgi:hypothetical protein
MNIPSTSENLTLKQVVQLKWLYQEQLRAKALGFNVRCVVKCKDCGSAHRLAATETEEFLTKEHPKHNVLIGLHETTQYVPFSEVYNHAPVISGKE